MVRLLPLSAGRRPAYQQAGGAPVTLEALRTGALVPPAQERAAPVILEALRKGVIQQPSVERVFTPSLLEALVQPGQRPAMPEPPRGPAPLLEALVKPGARPGMPAPPVIPPSILEALVKPGQRLGVPTPPVIPPSILQPLQPPQQRQAKPPSPARPIAQDEALRANPARTQTKLKAPDTSAAKLPAPVLGWYTAASIAEAPAGTAIVCENWYCERDALRVRRGHQPHATGMPAAPVETIVLYTSGDTEQMFGVCDGGIYDVTTPGAVGAAVVTGLSNSRFDFTNFANVAGQWLLMVNGEDDLVTYNGTTWDTVSADLFEADGITLLTELTSIWQYKERLWFTKAGSTDLWYLATDAITGTANKVTCGSLLARGGSMIAGTSWSVSDDSGKAEYLVAMSSEGEVLVFAGDDPNTADQWDFFGGYFLGKPLGPHCLFKVGGDILVLSQEGLLPLSQAIMLDRAVFSTAAMTKNIAPTFADFVQRYKDNHGWEMEELPTSNMVLLNVPTVENAEAQQIVWNTATSGMSLFTGLNACCWALFQDEIYFGGTGGIVYKAETGSQDVDDGITAYLLPAYDDLGAPAIIKHVKLIKALYETNVATPPEISIAVDYQDPANWGTAPGVTGPVFTWDVSHWDVDIWLRGNTFRAWQSGMNIGAAISPAVRVTIEDGGAANDLAYRLFAFHLLFEKGGVVG